MGGASPDEGFWIAIERELVSCLRDTGPMTPAEIGKRLDMSAGAAASLSAMLVTEGKVRICLVERVEPAEERLSAAAADR